MVNFSLLGKSGDYTSCSGMCAPQLLEAKNGDLLSHSKVCLKCSKCKNLCCASRTRGLFIGNQKGKKDGHENNQIRMGER